jgi:hypothetical protein
MNLTWGHWGLNSGLGGETPASNRLGDDTDLNINYKQNKEVVPICPSVLTFDLKTYTTDFVVLGVEQFI